MIVNAGIQDREEDVIAVFKSAFTASEGAEEGAAIEALVRAILAGARAADFRVFSAEIEGEVIGAVAFTRLRFPQDPQEVMLLSPMAVCPSRWRQGVGQALIRRALADLKAAGVKIVLTYGDPAYYRQVGFQTISEADAQPPLPLSMPHGWLGQRLGDAGKPLLKGPSECVAAFRRPELW